MSNQYFRFKQFTVHQDRCAMKVSTDACIQGAWTPVLPQVKKVLDIGTGTGLLSLMLAQRNTEIHIDAIELDEAAALQAKENIEASPWADRIHVMQGDVKAVALGEYDMVICNPPFFQKSLLGDTDERNIARHALTFNYEALLTVLNGCLKPEGYASILLPYAEHMGWQALLQKHDWRIVSKLQVQPKLTSGFNRVISLCARGYSTDTETSELCIYEPNHAYTPAFEKLMQPFYLKL